MSCRERSHVEIAALRPRDRSACVCGAGRGGCRRRGVVHVAYPTRRSQADARASTAVRRSAGGPPARARAPRAMLANSRRRRRARRCRRRRQRCGRSGAARRSARPARCRTSCIFSRSTMEGGRWTAASPAAAAAAHSANEAHAHARTRRRGGRAPAARADRPTPALLPARRSCRAHSTRSPRSTAPTSAATFRCASMRRRSTRSYRITRARSPTCSAASSRARRITTSRSTRAWHNSSSSSSAARIADSSRARPRPRTSPRRARRSCRTLLAPTAGSPRRRRPGCGVGGGGFGRRTSRRLVGHRAVDGRGSSCCSGSGAAAWPLRGRAVGVRAANSAPCHQ